LEELVNRSINEVLSRTVVTSLTTFIGVLAIFVLGGEVLHDFAFALLAGIIVGTYSSIFVASPLLVLWRGGRGRLVGGGAEARRSSGQAVKNR
jgi:preprotein translocase subunit SecF